VIENPASEFKGGMDRGDRYYQQLGGYLSYYAQDAYEEFEGEDGTGIDAVQIMTVHGAKGLEWPVVFLPSLQDRRFPASRAGRGLDWVLPDEVLPIEIKDRYAGGEEEERRLFYVAMTRARDALYVSHFERTEKRSSKHSGYSGAIAPPSRITRSISATARLRCSRDSRLMRQLRRRQCARPATLPATPA